MRPTVVGKDTWQKVTVKKQLDELSYEEQADNDDH